MVTSDHGNAETMLAADGSPDTAHSTDQVPLVVLDEGVKLREGAGLSDIAPTVLQFLGLEAPPEMTGRPLGQQDRRTSGRMNKPIAYTWPVGAC